MKPTFRFPKLLLFAAVVLPLLLRPVAAQAQAALQPPPPPAALGQKPVMETVFFNVVWGSAAGALLGLSLAVIGSSDASQPTETRKNTFNGATVGGLIGLGAGLYLVYQGISFNPAASQIVIDASDPGKGMARNVAFGAAPPVVLEFADSGPLRITGFRADVFRLRF